MTLVELAERKEKTAADGELDRSSKNFLTALCTSMKTKSMEKQSRFSHTEEKRRRKEGTSRKSSR